MIPVKIAIYGKGGIGKSTTTANLAAALAEQGLTVLQIGCDPKADSTQLLTGGKRIPTVLDQLREHDDDVTLDSLVHRGEGGVLCVEAGGPLPGIGCAGRGIIAAFEKLERPRELQAARLRTAGRPHPELAQRGQRGRLGPGARRRGRGARERTHPGLLRRADGRRTGAHRGICAAPEPAGPGGVVKVFWTTI